MATTIEDDIKQLELLGRYHSRLLHVARLLEAIGSTTLEEMTVKYLEELQEVKKASISPYCPFCGLAADGPMLTVRGALVHADCVIQKLNELLDPDYDDKGEPRKIIGYLKE